MPLIIFTFCIIHSINNRHILSEFDGLDFNDFMAVYVRDATVLITFELKINFLAEITILQQIHIR